MYYKVLVGSQRFHGSEPLTYSSEQPLEIGQIVQAPLGKTRVTGIVCETSPKPSFATKPITHEWSNLAVPAQTLALIEWLHAYYPAPLGSIVELFTPPALPKDIQITQAISPTKLATRDLPPLTRQQNDAIRTIEEKPNKSVLLHGNTGTGKTRIYIELAIKAVTSGKSVILTTPEIGLTAPLVETFTKTFGERVYVTHSGLTAAQRRKQWIATSTSEKPTVLIGPRSALFYPVKELGLVIIDEAHDGAYKQDQSPYYQATRVAAKLRELHNALLVMGTATPLVSDYYSFKAKNLPIIRLDEAAVTSEANVEHIVVDSRERTNFTKSAYLSNQLLDAMTKAIDNQEQSLLFLNRRGSARIVLCQACGWQALCPRCDTSLTFHADTHNMRCHSCDFKDEVPSSCPQCSATEVLFTSIGTKALEVEVAKHFPQATVARFDGDTHKSEGLTARFQELQNGTIDIVIGTQSVAKGFDLPKLSVVGVVQADSSLSIPDYSATERSFQLLSQVSGRIGRGHRDGTLLIQTHNPGNPTISQALNKDYASFYNAELREREQYAFPPFVHIMTVNCTRASSKSAEAACTKTKNILESSVSGISIDGPSPRFVEKHANKYSWHLVVRAKSRTHLTEAISHLPSGCIANLDPTDLL